MITLSVIIALWGIISTYRLYKIARKKQQPLHPYEGTIMDAMGFQFGLSLIATWICILCLMYMP
jgi:hypothetical protein